MSNYTFTERMLFSIEGYLDSTQINILSFVIWYHVSVQYSIKH